MLEAIERIQEYTADMDEGTRGTKEGLEGLGDGY
jgi:uncharacterized protein with HEPN domain